MALQVRHAAEGNPGALAQDAASMASSAARGAYESAKLVADTLTGGMLGLGGQAQSGFAVAGRGGVGVSEARRMCSGLPGCLLLGRCAG